MNYEVAELSEFYIIGIAVRTTNQNGKAQGEIGALWQHFIEHNIAAKIPNKASEDIYCMYTDYESDYTGMYTTILGCKVNSIADLPEGFTAKQIPASKYRIYKAEGEIPASVGAVWAEIWNAEAKGKAKLNRSYLADFDVYKQNMQNPHRPEVSIYLSVNG